MWKVWIYQQKTCGKGYPHKNILWITQENKKCEKTEMVNRVM